MISSQKQQEIIDALRRGTVPASSLDAFAVGLDHLTAAVDEELRKVNAGGSVFKAIRGEYGCGKTFFARWLADRARKLGFATSEVQISETETPLHRLETVYRRLTERLATADTPQGALRNIVDGWFFTLEEDVLAEGGIAASDAQQLLQRTNDLLEQLWSAEMTINAKMAATVLWPIDALPAQSAQPPGLRPGLDLPRDSVLGPHTRLSDPACPDRLGH
jgi:P-loop Domain of unknown function (DUF2791)